MPIDITYDPFLAGEFAVGVRTLELTDSDRGRVFPCNVWYPALPHPGMLPLIVFSHPSGGSRSTASYLCTHLSSHGYVVATMNHSEMIAPELKGKPGETTEEKAARMEALTAARVPDLRLLLDRMLNGPAWDEDIQVDPARVGAVGHSFGGWTVLAAAAEDDRIRALVALAPGGSSQRKPGMIPLTLTFAWGRDVPTLYLAAEDDISIPMGAIHDLFERTPGRKRLFVLRRADHMHFMDNVELVHEAVRNMPFTGDLAWIPKEMRPIAELCSGEKAHLFTRGLTLSHMDWVLRESEEAARFLAGDMTDEFAKRGIDAY